MYKLMTSARFRQIADDLQERVALGAFGVQGALDSESALCTRYAVSRVTVRRALETLREQGLVQSRQGSGWFASAGPFHQRLALGTFRHAGSAVADSGKVMLRRVLEFGYRQASPVLAATLGLAATGAAQEVLHCHSVRTVDDVPLDLVAEWVPAAIAGRVSRADAAAPGIWASLQRDGHRVASVRQTITAGIAGTSDAMLLDVAVGAPLLLVRRLARDEHKAPLALSDHRYLAHRFSLEVEFNGWPGAGADTPPGLHENETQAPADALGVAGVLPIQAGPGISHDLKESDS